MPLWIDEYRPKSFKELDFGIERATRLQSIVKKGDFPNLMFYGPAGVGKKTRVLCLLQELYGNGAMHVRMDKMAFTTAANKKLEIQTISSNYHIEINPADVGMHDRVVIMDLIKVLYLSHKVIQCFLVKLIILGKNIEKFKIFLIFSQTSFDKNVHVFSKWLKLIKSTRKINENSK